MGPGGGDGGGRGGPAAWGVPIMHGGEAPCLLKGGCCGVREMGRRMLWGSGGGEEDAVGHGDGTRDGTSPAGAQEGTLWHGG